jgi:hypothetical protein
MREGKIFFTLYLSRFTDETATGIAHIIILKCLSICHVLMELVVAAMV